MSADFTPTLEGYKAPGKFRFWCQHVLPLVYDDSLSYYELLCKVVDYINKLIEDNKAAIDNVNALLTAYNQLQQYVNDYFDNLDVQQEINNKLDELAQDGTLTDLISAYLDPLVAAQNERIAAFEETVGEDLASQTEFNNVTRGMLANAYTGPYPVSSENEIPDGENNIVWLGETGAGASGFTWKQNYWYYTIKENGSLTFILEGGLYQASGVQTDTTLSIPGMAADAAAAGNEITDLKEDLSQYGGFTRADWVDGKAYDTPSSVTTIIPEDMITVPTFSCTSLAVQPGDIVVITGTGGSGSKLWVWIDSDGVIIDRAGSNAALTGAELTAPENAAWLLSSVVTANPHSLTKGVPINTRFNNVNNKINENKLLSEIKVLDKIGSISLFDDTIYVDILSQLKQYNEISMNNPVFQTTTIFDYLDKATELTTGSLYEGLRVRDIYGNQTVPIFVDGYDPDLYLSANMAFGYKMDGTPDQRYNQNNVSNGEIIIGPDTYYLVFQTFSTLDVRFYTTVGTHKTDYYVGPGQEYTTFHDCLVALKNNETPKNIHVYGGTYDILQELGGSTFLDGLTGQENWYDVCDIIPPNTHVIGHGNVIFDLTIPAGTDNAKAVLLSPINMIKSASIENVTINCSGGRYSVHAEGSQFSDNNNAVWRLINCKINKTNNLNGTPNAIGVGLNDGNYLEIRNCIITNDGNAGLLVHDQQISGGKYAVSPRILVDGCAFDVRAYPIVMSSTHSGSVSGAVLEMTVINCYCGNKFMRKIGSGNADVFHATYVNTPHRIQNGDGLLNIIPDTDYSNFSLG